MAHVNMFNYERFFLEEVENDGSASYKFLTRTNMKDLRIEKPRNNVVLTDLVRFAKTRRHNNNNRNVTSVCSKCNRRKSSDFTWRCKRWNETEDIHNNNNSNNGNSYSSQLKPFCEVLGSMLCNDCIAKKIKKNHVLHLPVVFGDINELSSSPFFNERALIEEGKSPRTTRPNTPVDESYFEKKEKPNESQLRLEMTRMSLLPNSLRRHRDDLNEFKAKESKRTFLERQPSYDLKETFSSSLNSSVANRLANLSPMKIIKMKRYHVPCNTPINDALIPKKKQAKQLDVILLAQRLETVYRQRYLPVNIIKEDIDNYGDEESSNQTNESEDGCNSFNYHYDDDDDLTYKALLTSPPEINSTQSRQIRKEYFL
eukprot:gene12640-13938_t